MITLAIENSGPCGSVALMQGNRAVAVREFESPRGRGTKLFEALSEILSERRKPGRIVVGTGPGSYNGIRSAIAAAWGLSVAFEAELAGVSSLLGHDCPEYVAVGDARGAKYYFAHVRDGKFVTPASLFPLSEILGMVNGKLPVFCPSPVEEIPQARVQPPLAGHLVRGAVHWDGVLPEPMYLKPPHVTVPRGT